MTSDERKYTEYLIKTYNAFLYYYNLDPSHFKLDIVAVHDISKRFFKDIDRLKRYHSILKIDNPKIAGFTTYWIAKLKPISIINTTLYQQNSKLMVYINEIYALCVATAKLLCKTSIANIRVNEEFLTMFLYTLKYRKYSGDTLSLVYYLAEYNIKSP